MEHRFTGTPLVLGPSEVPSYTSVLDLQTSRNEKMITALLKPGITGMFLFYIKKDAEGTGTGFVLPPGLSPQAMREFEHDFAELFERYAARAMKA